MTFGGEGSREETLALADIDISVEEGDFVCLLGPSGCGKSTLLNLIAGFIKPSSGRVLLDGREVGEPDHDRGMVFQEPTLYDWLDVSKNISFGLDMRGVSKEETARVVREYIEITGLTGFEHFSPFELSGGMKQRVALARAMAGEPRVLLMDEPFSALDPGTRQDMQDLLVTIRDNDKRTVILVTHDINEALFLGDRVIVLSSRPGRIKEDIDLRGYTFSDRRTEIIERPDMTAIHKRIMLSVKEG